MGFLKVIPELQPACHAKGFEAIIGPNMKAWCYPDAQTEEVGHKIQVINNAGVGVDQITC